MVQTIERTGKTYKAWMLVFGVAAVLGLVATFRAPENGITPYMFWVGLIGWVVVKGLAWWNHG